MREPRQDRSKRTLERILEAGFDLLAEGGWDAITIGAVERRTGISRGSFYNRFASRDALLAYVLEQLQQRAAADTAELLGEVEDHGYQDLDSAVHSAVGAIGRIFEIYTSRLIHGEEPQPFPAANDAATPSSLADMSARFQRIVSPFIAPSEDARIGVEFAVRLTFQSFAIRAHGIDPFVMHAPLAFDEHVARLGDAVSRYLAQYELRPEA